MEFDRVPEIAKYLSLVYLLAWFGRSTVWNFLPIYIEQNIPNVFLVGLITSLPAALPILLDIPVGNLVQRAGEKVVIVVGLVVGAIPPLLYFTALPAMLAAGKAVEGVSKALVWNGGWSVAMKSADEDFESEAISVFLLGLNISIILAPILGGYLIASRGFTLTFSLWVFTSLLSVLMFLSYIGLERQRGFVDSLEDLFHRQTYTNDWHHLKENWSLLRFPLTLMFLYSIIFSFYWLAVPLLLDQINADFVTMGIIFGVAALPKAFQFLFGDLADRWTNKGVVALLSFLVIPVMVALSTVTDVLMVGVLFFIARIFSAGLSPPMHAMFDSHCPEEYESELTGFLELFKHSGQALGPLIAGTIASIWSINTSFLAAGGVAALIFLLILRH